MIRLYKARTKSSTQRDVVNQWKGLLMSYAVLNWFREAQFNGLLSGKIQWPNDEELGKKILEVKKEADMKVFAIDRVSATSTNPGK